MRCERSHRFSEPIGLLLRADGSRLAVEVEVSLAVRFDRELGELPVAEHLGARVVRRFELLAEPHQITAENVAGSYNVIGGFAYYSRLFDFRAGVGYGRFIVPRVGFVYLETGVVLDFAAYFRF